MIKVERNPDGSIKAAYSVDASGMRLYGSDPTPIPVLGSMPQATKPSLDAILGNVKVDPITGRSGRRTFDEFKNFIKINKESFIRDKGTKYNMPMLPDNFDINRQKAVEEAHKRYLI